jgi:tripeptidyl-peptidase-2
MSVCTGERSFAIKVDPTLLEAGSHHYAEIVGIDVDQPDAGPVFKVPITVIRPLRIERGPGTTRAKDCLLRLV